MSHSSRSPAFRSALKPAFEAWLKSRRLEDLKDPTLGDKEKTILSDLYDEALGDLSGLDSASPDFFAELGDLIAHLEDLEPPTEVSAGVEVVLGVVESFLVKN